MYNPYLSNYFSKKLSSELMLCVASKPIEIEALSLNEKKLLDGFQSESRRLSWRRGRLALKEILHALAIPHDTALLEFPQTNLSLTHGKEISLAVALCSSTQMGIGIDYQAGDAPHPKSTRFFLTEAEQAWLNQQPVSTQADHLLRLWTVKEALFKADLNNKNAHYVHYETTNPATVNGICSRLTEQYQYATLAWQNGYLTVALKEKHCV